jgi:hypothetical protein
LGHQPHLLPLRRTVMGTEMSNDSVPTTQSEPYGLTISVGERASPEGRTRATVDAAGMIVVEHEQAEVEEMRNPLRGEMPDGRDLMAKADDFPWDSSFPQRPGIPDEAVVVWTLSSPRGSREARFWIGDVESDERMHAVLHALREAVRRVSQGELYL